MSLIRKLRDRLQGATLHDLWVETRWVLHHSKRYRRSIAAYVLLGIASIALSLLSSLSSRELINAIVYLKGGGRRVLFCGVTVVLLAGSTIVLNALVSRFSAKINLRVGNELRAEVFGMFLNTDWESLQQFHSGDLLSRINTDVSNVAGSVLGWIPSLILRLTQFLASLAASAPCRRARAKPSSSRSGANGGASAVSICVPSAASGRVTALCSMPDSTTRPPGRTRLRRAIFRPCVAFMVKTTCSGAASNSSAASVRQA